MRCPVKGCLGLETQVVITKDQGEFIRRKRKCCHCGAYFWTTETFTGYTNPTMKKLIKELRSGQLGDSEELQKAIDDIEASEYDYKQVPNDGVQIIAPRQEPKPFKIKLGGQ